jgi:hypothetical protein
MPFHNHSSSESFIESGTKPNIYSGGITKMKIAYRESEKQPIEKKTE